MWTLIITIFLYDNSASQLMVPGFDTKQLCIDAQAENTYNLNRSFKLDEWTKRPGYRSNIVYSCVKTR